MFTISDNGSIMEFIKDLDALSEEVKEAEYLAMIEAVNVIYDEAVKNALNIIKPYIHKYVFQNSARTKAFIGLPRDASIVPADIAILANVLEFGKPGITAASRARHGEYKDGLPTDSLGRKIRRVPNRSYMRKAWFMKKEAAIKAYEYTFTAEIERVF